MEMRSKLGPRRKAGKNKIRSPKGKSERKERGTKGEQGDHLIAIQNAGSFGHL